MALGNRFSQHSFAQIPDVRIQRSQFDRSYTVKDTFLFDYLVPFHVDEILPGDTVNLSVNSFARLATQKVPIMDNMYVDFFFFFVPNRLVWENWERFNGAQDNPDDTTDYVLPTMPFAAGGPEVGTIYDHMGLPTDVTNAWTLNNTLPLRAYLKIYNDWFRDQNLNDTVPVPIDDGPDAITDFTLLTRNQKQDYFTSCLPWPQKGPAVELPLGTSAPVISSGANPKWSTVDNTTTNSAMYVLSGSGAFSWAAAAPGSSKTLKWGNETGLTADLANAVGGTTINQFREAISMQALFELDARGGTRYVEILRAHFNVVSPDFRLQRAEFLGMGTTKINSHPVAQTAPTSGSNPQAQLAAFATQSTSGSNIGFTKSFVEHGYVLGIMCARGEVTYQQGINRMWNRSTRYDFYWPKLSELGEQAVLRKELFVDGSVDDEDVFGYQERYAEYRYKPSEIRGQFRSTFATSLDMWHLSRELDAGSAQLTADFLAYETPIERALALTAPYPHLLIDMFISQKHARPMPVYSTPATLGRF